MCKSKNGIRASDYILLLTAIIIVVGWFVNSSSRIDHEITMKRTDVRIETLKEYMSFSINAEKTKSLKGFNDIQVAFYLYGYDDEIKLIKEITSIVTTNPKNPKWLHLMHELNILIRGRLREELNFPAIKSV